MLVFATLHAPARRRRYTACAASALHPHFLANSLRGILSQRLVRTLCPQCRVSFDLTDAPRTLRRGSPLAQPRSTATPSTLPTAVLRVV